MRTHDWIDLSIDFEMAKTLNKIDQAKHIEEINALYGKK
jgi:hypothetical protein